MTCPAAFPLDPALIAASYFSDGFDDGALPVWTFSTGWALAPDAVGNRLLVASGESPALAAADLALDDQLVTFALTVESGGAGVELRRSDAGAYRVIFGADGVVRVSRSGVPLCSALLPSLAIAGEGSGMGGSFSVEIWLVGGMLTVIVDGTPILTAIDPSPLVSGSFALVADASAQAGFDDLEVSSVERSGMFATPSSGPIDPDTSAQCVPQWTYTFSFASGQPHGWEATRLSPEVHGLRANITPTGTPGNPVGNVVRAFTFINANLTRIATAIDGGHQRTAGKGLVINGSNVALCGGWNGLGETCQPAEANNQLWWEGSVTGSVNVLVWLGGNGGPGSLLRLIVFSGTGTNPFAPGGTQTTCPMPTPTASPTRTPTATPTPRTCTGSATGGDLYNEAELTSFKGFLQRGSLSAIMLVIRAVYVGPTHTSYLIDVPAGSLNNAGDPITGQAWINANFVNTYCPLWPPATYAVTPTPTPTGTLTPPACPARAANGVNVMARFAYAEMAGEASITPQNAPAIATLMIVQLNQYANHQTWKATSSVPASQFNTIVYDYDDYRILVKQIAETLLTAWCATGTVAQAYQAAVQAGYIDQALYDRMNALTFFGDPQVTFEISIHPDRITQAEATLGERFIGFAVSSAKAVLIGTASSVNVVYQCQLTQQAYIVGNPNDAADIFLNQTMTPSPNYDTTNGINDSGEPISVTSMLECLATCPDTDYWYVTARNSAGQTTGFTLSENLVENERNYAVCDG